MYKKWRSSSIPKLVAKQLPANLLIIDGKDEFSCQHLEKVFQHNFNYDTSLEDNKNSIWVESEHNRKVRDLLRHFQIKKENWKREEQKDDEPLLTFIETAPKWNFSFATATNLSKIGNFSFGNNGPNSDVSEEERDFIVSTDAVAVCRIIQKWEKGSPFKKRAWYFMWFVPAPIRNWYFQKKIARRHIDFERRKVDVMVNRVVIDLNLPDGYTKPVLGLKERTWKPKR